MLQLCREKTRDTEEKYWKNISSYIGVKPIHVGVDPHFTLDSTSNIEKVFNATAQQSEGDIGGSCSEIQFDAINASHKSEAWQLLQAE